MTSRKETLKDKMNHYQKLKTIRSQATSRLVDIHTQHKLLYTHETGQDDPCEMCHEFKLFFNLNKDLGKQLEGLKKDLGFIKLKEKRKQRN